ncbi:MAG: aminodeoxychorismate/anthranilate synthase component II [Clostridiales bacterium]|jgi:anthranilate synthase component 2|nr:aminodeoxychorismate/anthranilate synthase component II [Clostridiales bacterium]
MILLIDNYDSFSYNLYQLIGEYDQDVKVVRNDKITLGGIEELHPSCLILSPGPGRPADSGICPQAIKRFAGRVPILGVCLGHQAICEAFGATVGYAKTLMHGKPSRIKLDSSCPIFESLPESIQGARYHSLAAFSETIPKELAISATSDDDEVMAVRHKDFEVYGLQFHPESILTPHGGVIIFNFLRRRTV